ncbi:helix-turn-helix domain-containing protein [Nocardia harenae]|uniref:helix-turn-helix domain-containing protein n=1 Tax=Nocardia harenae TaxID=358707 RepID=UPI000830F516|nr:AraC family transcriptional regulator [Nocardia harenae]
MTTAPEITAWRPRVGGIDEVFHARFTDHAYPPHTHEAWTLLIVDAGAIRYQLDRHEHGSHTDAVTLLPPQVPHDGRSAVAAGFRKRVLYLAPDTLTGIGRAADNPTLRDAALRDRLHRLHGVLALPGEELEAQSRLAFVLERVRGHLDGVEPSRAAAAPGLAHALRDLLDADVVAGLTLEEAGRALHADPAHLVRAFSREFGIAPHRYLVGRRVDRARRLLLAGQRAADVAAASGFYDQAHLNRHFTRMLGTTPARYAGKPRRLAGTVARCAGP